MELSSVSKSYDGEAAMARNRTPCGVLRQLALGLLVAVIWLASCGSNNNKTPGLEPHAKALESGPAEFSGDFRSSSLFVTKMSGMHPGTGPHGLTQIWYSKNIESLLDKGSFDPVPEGTVAIKPYDMDGQPGVDGIAVMIKKPKGYDPGHNDWYYENRTPDGNRVTEMPAPGRNPMCYQCHAGGASTDYLLGTKLR